MNRSAADDGSSRDGTKPEGALFDRPSRHGNAAPTSRRRRFALLAVGLVVLVLCLALGLGLGLGLKRGESGGGGGTGATPTTSGAPFPTPTAVWRPPVGASWQIILSRTLTIDASSPAIEPNVDVWDIDLFLHQNNSVIPTLRRLGKKVICYFSAGSYESYRPDSSQFKKEDLGAELDGWPGEFWLNTKSSSVRDIMRRRIQMASAIGCDAIDPDNVDGFQNTNGLGLTKADATDFVKFLAEEARRYNLAIGLKNAGDIISSVLSEVQFCVNEQCAEHSECSTFAAFTAAGKPVFNIEYPQGAPRTISASSLSSSCAAERTYGFSTVLKSMDLDGGVTFCNGQSAFTSVR